MPPFELSFEVFLMLKKGGRSDRKAVLGDHDIHAFGRFGAPRCPARRATRPWAARGRRGGTV